MDKYKVGVIGAGAWGTALATALARGGHDVTVWALEVVLAALDTVEEAFAPALLLPFELLETD